MKDIGKREGRRERETDALKEMKEKGFKRPLEVDGVGEVINWSLNKGNCLRKRLVSKTKQTNKRKNKKQKQNN